MPRGFWLSALGTLRWPPSCFRTSSGRFCLSEKRLLSCAYFRGSLALAQGLTAAWMGLQTIRDLRASPVPYSGEYLRCLRRPLNEATDKFMDGTGIPPKYAIPVFLRKDGERDPHLFFAPLSFLNDLIALEAARKRGGVPRVRGAYLPHTHVTRDLSANNTMHQSVESFTSR